MPHFSDNNLGQRSSALPVKLHAEDRRMNVFISSLIRGLEGLRDAVAAGIGTLGHRAVRAEDFGASPDSAQAACLAGVRESDAMILILSSRYGHEQASGLSATHEEYREARDTRPVIVFVEQGIDPEPQQAAFIKEVQSWERGHFTAEFRDATDLRDKAIRAMHDYALAHETAPLDEAELARRAESLVPRSQRTSGTDLIVVIAAGPQRTVIRPAELEVQSLHRFLMAEALTGADAVLTPARGTDQKVRGDTLQLVQEQGGSSVALDEGGNLVIVQPAVERDEGRFSGITSIIEEQIQERLICTLRFAARVLDHIDSTKRISHVAVVTALRGGGHMPWRTREEQQRSPNAASMNTRATDLVVVSLSPPVRRRAALAHDTHRLAEDFTVRLRREVTR